ncbi:MAG TPA: MtnX-like HAD-IB family phosphatase [Terriglobia bacterium]|nr:MtnX-like HAD-IB family phosphatase [Terriglobia bacterium]
MIQPHRGVDASAPPEPIIFCDFDGTITRVDVTDEILIRLADPAWREIESLWTAGTIGSRECLERQLALVKTSAQELNALIDSIPIDPAFAKFVRFVQRSRIPFVVVSDGLDCVIRRVLAHAGLHSRGRNGIHFYSSSGRLIKGRLAVSFPHATANCAHGCATCKPQIIRALREDRWPVIYIGDGLSDRHAVAEADFVCARQPLLDFCRSKGIPARPFNTFDDIECALAGWLGSHTTDETAKTERSRALAAFAANE